MKRGGGIRKGWKKANVLCVPAFLPSLRIGVANIVVPLTNRPLAHSAEVKKN
jgi:hypothetical protein